MSAIQGDITKQGIQMLTRAQAGEALVFTRFAIGDGFMEPDETLRDAEKLKNELFSVRILSTKPGDIGRLVIEGLFTNENYPQGFMYRELGLYARIGEDVDEQLYCYGNAYDAAEPIPPSGAATLIEKRIRTVVIIGYAEHVSAILEVTLGVSHEEFEQDQQRQDAEIDALRNRTSVLGDDVSVLYDLLFNDINSNAFLITFNTLDGVDVEGVWNQAQQRIEF